MVDRERYCFRLSAYNELAGVDDKFLLFYFVRNDGRIEIEMLECKHRRKHLARIAFPHLAALDVRPGAKLVIFGRQYRVEDYEDKHTRDALARAQATTVALVTPQGMPAFGRVWAAAEASGLRVVAARQVALSGEDAAWACSHLAAPLSGPGAVLALQFLGEDAEAKVGALGAHLEAAGMPRGALCCARAGAEAAVAELSAGFFGPPAARRPSARAGAISSGGSAAAAADAGASAACVMVLPHALLAGAAGSILAELCSAMDRAAAAGCPPLTVAACRMVDLSRGQAEEFLEVYKDVVPEYSDMLNEYSSGPMVALEIVGEDAVAQLRSMVGPRDVDVARRVRGDTLRAKFGVPSSTGGPGFKAKLGLHCTDLAEDGPLECEYLFSLVDR